MVEKASWYKKGWQPPSINDTEIPPPYVITPRL